VFGWVGGESVDTRRLVETADRYFRNTSRLGTTTPSGQPLKCFLSQYEGNRHPLPPPIAVGKSTLGGRKHNEEEKKIMV